MKCRERTLELMEYAAGTLEENRARLLEEHLTSCASCQGELESWRRLEAELRAFPVVPEPADFKASVLRRIERPHRAPVVPGLGWLELGAGLALAVVVSSVLALLVAVVNGVDGGSLWQWRHEAAIWMELYLETAYPNLVVASAILASALGLAAFIVGNGEVKRAFDLH